MIHRKQPIVKNSPHHKRGIRIEMLERRALMAAVASVSPSNLGIGAGVNSHVQVTFTSAMTASTITGSTFQLLDGASVVPGRLSYNSSGKTATLDSNAPLSYGKTYNVVVKGGASGVKDSGNGILASDYAFSFTTAADPATGAGGPILVITKSTNPYSKYYPEILRAEGLNAFSTADIATVSAASLANYKLVILGEMTLTAAQVSTISTWVNNGGKLIAMRPDKQLAGLLGLTDTGATINDTYLDIDNSNPVGSGLTATSMQYHSTADRYTLSGATSLAALFSNSTTSTGNPAVTTRSVGANGGQAAAFVFDLAKSVIQTRQGNPLWSGQERDGSTPIRSDDLFFGGASPDWVDLTKVAIPQADEQQRLLANMITTMIAPVMPIPRLWYFPNGAQAQVVMTGDDHNAGGTIGRWNNYTTDGLSGGQSIRGTSYVFPSSFTDSQGALYTSQGFEMGLHIDITSSPVFGNSGDIGINWTSLSQLDSLYTSELNTYNSAFPSIPTPSTVRTHAIVWSDYDSQPQVEFSHRIRLDTNYYYWPGTWVLDRPGMFTGSGMPMRFAKLDGSLIDVYQAATQITDESSQTEPKTINALLDGATGASGYYGAFTVNAHTDGANSAVSDAVIASAKAHNVPVITADALLRWTDGRNASNFDNLAWNDAASTLTFTQVVGVGASGLQAMLPMQSGTNLNLSTITVNGNPVAFTQQNIKGINYAFYPATAGSVTVQYAPDAAPPTVVAKTPASNATNIPVTVDPTVTFNEDVQPGTISIILKNSANVTIPGVTTYDSNSRTATFTPAGNLSPSAAYTVTVSGAMDLSNNTMVGSTSWTFTTAGTGPFNIWSNAVTPSTPFLSDGSVELGVKFKADVDGFITGVRFYKGSGSTGAHTGTLWSSAGSQLATATFAETATGWQTVSFASPVAITAGTTYVASYHASNGYAADSNYFSNAVDNVYLHALSDSAAGGNGLYRYGASTIFPNNSFGATNYWVDVVYSTNLTDNTPPTVVTRVPSAGATNVTLASNIQAVFNEALQAGTAVVIVKDAAQVAVAGATTYDANTKTVTFDPTANLAATTTYSVTVTGAKDIAGNTMASTSWSFTTATPDTTAPTITSTTPAGNATAVAVGSAITATFSEAVQAGTIVVTVNDAALNPIAGSSSYNSANNTVTFTPGSSLLGTTTYTVTITGAKDVANNTMSQYAWSFTTAAAPTTYSFWNSSTVPSSSTNNDGASIETGFKFSASVSGFVGGIRFYKGTGNTGTHIGNLWSSTGTLLAAATFSGESATGWQQVNFPTPVAITAGTTYVASYFSPTGTYNADPGYFATSRDNGPIHALSNAESANGLYRYTGASAFPNSAFGSTNYWVDIVFSTNSAAPDTTPPTVTSTTPSSGATNVAISSALTASFNETVQLATINFTLKDNNNINVPGATTYNDTTHTATFTPSAPLNGFTTYTATVTGAKDTAGNTMLGSTIWSFTTATVDSTPPTVTASSPTNGATNISTASAITITFSEAVQSSSIVMTLKDAANNTISGSVNYNRGTQTATFTPSALLSASTTYTMTVTGAKDLANNTMAQISFSFSTAAAAATYSFFTPGATPSTTNNYDGSAIEVGFKFSANAAGSVTGIRFYKGSQDTGTHIGNLWSSTGTLLATINFSGESASGWQQMNFSTPVALTPGTTYVATYFSPTGRYSADSNYFTSAINNGPIHAFSNTESPNGVYRYTSSSAFPSGSFGASNYWVDIVFTPAAPADTTPPVVNSTTPSASATNVATNTTISASFNETIQSGTATYLVKDAALNTIAGIISYSANSAVFTPTSALVSSTTYTVTLSGAKDTAGNAMAATTWSFTTAASADTTDPTITSTTPTSGQTGVSPSAPISATFSEPVQAGTIVVSVKDAALNTVAGTTSFNAGTNAVVFTPTSSLAGTTTYTVTISGAKDLANNTMTQFSWSFTTAAVITTWTQTSSADFTAGTTTGTAITNTAGGEIQLAAAFLDDFNGTALSANWTVSANAAGSGTPATTVSGGSVSVGRQQIRTVQTFIDRGIEGSVTFNTANNEQFGLATDILATAGNSGAYFTTKNTTNTLYARVNQNGTLTDVSLGALPAGAHIYAIYPVPTGFSFYIDGILKTTVAQTLPAGTPLRAALSSQNASKPIVASYVKILSFTTGGTYTSSVRDTGKTSTWGTLNYNATLPAGTSVIVEISTGNTATPDGAWSAFTAVANGDTISNSAARYIRFRITFITTDPTQTATLNDISISYT